MSEIKVANPFGNALAPSTDEPAGALTEVAARREIAEVQGAIVMARRFPRDQTVAADNILRACTRLSLAENALYSYARGGSDITGPSIRLAEVLAQNWTNLAFGVRELEQRADESTVEAYCFDLETNVRQSRIFQVKHIRATRREARRLTDPRDIYELVANQGARRLRACILGIIPGDVVEAAVAQCEETLHAKADTSPAAIAKMVDSFAQFGVTKEMIEARIQRRLEAIRPAQVVQLRKIWSSLNDGMSTPGDWFETTPTAATPAPPPGNEGLRATLAERASPTTTPIPAQPQPAATNVVADPTLVIKPLRLRGGGWNWPKYTADMIAMANLLQPDQVEEFRTHNEAMLGSLRASDGGLYAQVEAALTRMTDDRDQTTEIS